jgi:MFS transporter, ACS family, allantoate permease
MSMPAGAIGVIFVLFSGWLSDKLRDRSLVMFICIIPTILAGAMMIGFDPHGKPLNKAALLAASFLSGTFGAAFMLLLAWNASNIAGHTKKVTTNALTLVSFAVGNILGTQTFQQHQAPAYTSGKISICATLGALCFVIVALRLSNDRLNKQNVKKREGLSEEEINALKDKLAFADKTDRENMFFEYTH